jgi:hypothetical protein
MNAIRKPAIDDPPPIIRVMRARSWRKCQQMARDRGADTATIARIVADIGARVMALQSAPAHAELQDKLIRHAEVFSDGPVIFVPVPAMLAESLHEAAQPLSRGDLYSAANILLASAVSTFERDGQVWVGGNKGEATR